VFRIDAGSGVPIYRQLMEQVRREVMLGRLVAGDQLPPLREVVDALAINPNTVVKAYAELEHEGLVLRRQGMGTFVTAVPPAGVLLLAIEAACLAAALAGIGHLLAAETTLEQARGGVAGTVGAALVAVALARAAPPSDMPPSTQTATAA